MSDLHLSDKAPTARLEQEAGDWDYVMESTMCELHQVCAKFRVPLIIAGDLFDTPRPSPGLILQTWTLLPKEVFVVAGNHDLPNHSMSELHDCALGLLIHTKRVSLLSPHKPTKIGSPKKHLHVYGFSWCEPFTQADPDSFSLQRNVAIVHRYCWVEGHTHPGAKPEDHIDAQIKELQSLCFFSAVWGDNHRNHWKPSEGGEGTRWYNSGVAIPRNSDFKDYQPTYALLMDDGTFKVQDFVDAKPQWQPWVDEKKVEKASGTLIEFAREVSKLVGTEVSANFLDELEAVMRGIKDEDVRKKVWEILQKAQGTKR